MQANAKFLIGATSFYITSAIASDLQKTRSCDEAKRAKQIGNDALLYTQQGGACVT